MRSTRVVTGIVIIGALAIAPAFAEQGQRRRSDANRRGERTEERAAPSGDRAVERAVPRSRDAGRPSEVQRQEVQRQEVQRQQQQAQRQYETQRQVEAQRQVESQRQRDAQRQNDSRRNYDGRREYDGRRDDHARNARRDYDARRDHGRPNYSNWGGNGRTVIRPRIIRPNIVAIVPYRPYSYRPSIGIGVYYGSGGSYPYGHTPRGYYDPIPGRLYGGLRITDAPRSAHVFADGYYVGIVNDFDGIFQHLNLEAGAHRIEIDQPGFEPIAFDVMIQPGRTITFRADMYPY